MKPLHFLAVLPVALLGLCVADKEPASAHGREPGREHGDLARRQFQRDLPLIESLVKEGLNIAAEEDALKRALACNRLAEGFAQEVRQAATKKEVARVADLSNYLQGLTRGVALNVAVAHSQLPPDSPRMGEMERIVGLVNSVMQPVEADLKEFPPSADKLMTGILEMMQKARTEVDNASKGRGRGRDRDRDRDKSKGKGAGKDRKHKK